MTKKRAMKIRRADIAEAFCAIESLKAMRRFFDEIFTPAERKDIVLRWELMKMLADGMPQRAIASKLGISLCKITRGARIVHDPGSVTNRIFKRHISGREERL